LTDHAKTQMTKRGISEAEVTGVLAAPEQVGMERKGRHVYQGRVHVGEPQKAYLLRVFVDTEPDPPAVITTHRTSKVSKYWRSST
jgi:hypothetical protein